MQSCAFVGLNYSNLNEMQGMENMKQATNVTRALRRREILENSLSKNTWQKGVDKINKSQDI